MAGAPLRKLEFVLFEFSELVDVSAVVVESIGNSFNSIWAAGGATAPNLGLELLTALAGYTFVNPPFQAPGVVSHTVALSGVRYLVVGAQAPAEVGDFGPIASESFEPLFYINGLDIATTPGGTTGGGTSGGTSGGTTTGGGTSEVPEPGSAGLLAVAGLAWAAAVRSRRAR